MATVNLEIKQAQIALKAGMADYFLNRFKNPYKIRVLSEFQSQSAFIDIETTGLTVKDEITTIAVLKDGEISLFIDEMNLSDFLETIQGVKLLITFNGTRFDLPFIRKCFAIDLTIPHLDLMSVLKQLGYAGGQKRCEELLYLKRFYSNGMRGKDAILLWKNWQQNRDQAALHQLMRYNAEDVFMLEKLAIKSYNLVMKSFPLRLNLKSSTSSNFPMNNIISNYDL